MYRLFLALSLLGLVSCGQTAEPNYPTTVDDLKSWVSETDHRICDLSLSQMESFDDLAKTLEKYLAFTPDQNFDIRQSPAEVKEFARRAALRRRLRAGLTGHELANTFYDEMKTGTDANLERIAFINSKVDSQQERTDLDSPEYNIRFCVLNELRGDLLYNLRRNLLEEIELGTLKLDSDLITLLDQDKFSSSTFRKALMQKLVDEGLVASLDPLDRAKLQGPESPILPFAPRTADEFWVTRDEEIEAWLDHIKTYAYETPAAKLSDMTHMDQTLRRFWGDPSLKAHFENETEYEEFKKGISKRIVLVDQTNTQSLQTMLEFRNWFRDDKDGERAASNAWLIAQHADRNPEFQKDVLARIKKAWGDPGVSASNYAYLYDRVGAGFGAGKTDEERIQRYGTQGRCTEDGWQPIRLEDPERVDEFRAEVGLGPLEDYKKRFNCKRR